MKAAGRNPGQQWNNQTMSKYSLFFDTFRYFGHARPTQNIK
jgi:hypothetical protein